MGKTKTKIKEEKAESEETVKTVSKKDKKLRSKKYQESKKKVNPEKVYTLSEAISLVKDTSYTKFDASVEVHAVIKKQGATMSITFPHTFGAEKKVEVASDTTIESLKKGKVEFDILLATADMMPKLVPFAKLLGPKGLMPNPKNGTLIKKASDAKSFSTSSRTIKTEKSAPVVHAVVGKVKMSDKEIEENIKALLKAIGKNQVVKGYLASTMGPSIKVDLN